MRALISMVIVSALAVMVFLFLRERHDYDVLQSVVESKFERTNFVWLTHYSPFLNEFVKSALIFGYEDNHAVCLEVAEDSEKRYVGSRYRCEFVGN